MPWLSWKFVSHQNSLSFGANINLAFILHKYLLFISINLDVYSLLLSQCLFCISYTIPLLTRVNFKSRFYWNAMVGCFSVMWTNIWKAYLQLLSKCMLQVYSKKASLVIWLLFCQLYFTTSDGAWCKDTWRGLLLHCRVLQLRLPAWGAFSKANLTSVSAASISFCSLWRQMILGKESWTLTEELRCKHSSSALTHGYGGHSIRVSWASQAIPSLWNTPSLEKPSWILILISLSAKQGPKPAKDSCSCIMCVSSCSQPSALLPLIMVQLKKAFMKEGN